MKNKKVLLGMGTVVLAILFYFVGSTTAKTTLNEKALSYSQLEQEIQKKNDELKTVTDNLSAKQKEFDTIKATYEEAKNLVSQKEKIKTDIQAAQKEQSAVVSKIDSTNKELQAKQVELEKLSNAIVAKKQAPKQLPAGHFTVGKDIEAGRYKVTASGQGSNYVVYDSLGGLKVNAILGGSFGVSEYIVELADGDKIQEEMRVKYTAIE
ncbi:hypothetical protein [Aneurinibacillus aneurinilyticus]|uniref:hypothetical protein n=1 Tax=Aneurinibacillus aneurinilyticus TaxID=1391 RepID=UPI0023F573F9|nr:hypothetical protein [Aneurinibacillus aneurinilyticus]